MQRETFEKSEKIFYSVSTILDIVILHWVCVINTVKSTADAFKQYFYQQ